MKASPIMICRTRNVDYFDFFCLPIDIKDSNLLDRLRNSIHANDLYFLDNKSKHIRIIINDKEHVIIGKMIVIEDITDMEIDLQLDHQASSRTLWGFIGAVFKTTEYCSNPFIADLDDSYYMDTFMNMVYIPHWHDSIFNGPYNYPYEEVSLIEVPETINPFPDNEHVISSDNNISAVNFTLQSIHEGKVMSLYTNAEYSASNNISQGFIDYATVSLSKIDRVRQSLSNKFSEMTKKKNEGMDERSISRLQLFEERLTKLCEEFHIEKRKIQNSDGNNLESGWFVITSTSPTSKKDKGGLFSLLNRQCKKR